MALTTKPLPREWLPKLSQFLADGFSAKERGTSDFYSGDVLEWKYFAERGLSPKDRSMIVTDGERILSHLGLIFTEIRSADRSFEPVPALHMIDWLSSPEASAAGGILLVKTLKRTPITYALGCSDAARRVLLGVGFQEIASIPLFHSVLNPANKNVWRELHGDPPLGRKLALRGLDLAQNLRKKSAHGQLSLQAVTEFGPDDLKALTNRHQILFSSREPAVLNHLLRHPHRVVDGWRICDGSERRGFALTSLVQKPGRRLGKIVDVILSTDSPAEWGEAISKLRERLEKQGADIVSCYASTPWVLKGLQHAGFFRRGRTPLYLRDPESRVPLNIPFHITHLEGDAAIL